MQTNVSPVYSAKDAKQLALAAAVSAMTLTTTDDITAQAVKPRENSVIELRELPSCRFRLCDFYIYATDHKVES